MVYVKSFSKPVLSLLYIQFNFLCILELVKKSMCSGGGWCVNLFECSTLVQTRPLALDLDWDQSEQYLFMNFKVIRLRKYIEYLPNKLFQQFSYLVNWLYVEADSNMCSKVTRPYVKAASSLISIQQSNPLYLVKDYLK